MPRNPIGFHSFAFQFTFDNDTDDDGSYLAHADDSSTDYDED